MWQAESFFKQSTWLPTCDCTKVIDRHNCVWDQLKASLDDHHDRPPVTVTTNFFLLQNIPLLAMLHFTFITIIKWHKFNKKMNPMIVCIINGTHQIRYTFKEQRWHTKVFLFSRCSIKHRHCLLNSLKKYRNAYFLIN